MTRNLLALFALLSGLAAFSGAGSAAYAAPTPSCNACLSASDAEGSEQAQIQVQKLVKNSHLSSVSSGRNFGAMLPIWVRAALIMGVERAHE